MMKVKAIQYLALDVHQATIVGTVRSAEGKITMRATVRPDVSAILNLVRSAGPRVHIAFEEGTQAQRLHDLLMPHAEKVMSATRAGASGVGTRAIGSTPIDVPFVSCNASRQSSARAELPRQE